ncbi:MAG TPA: lysophospholipid acyltransferase family protein [Polyangiaceae bacterium]|jgi:KDO2-lipid IV(A) lauroyltransferase|nr:lysophospholipid acyltransferase family protein [Polyangiaceae bacterium]
MPVRSSSGVADARDLRQGGEWTALQRTKNDVLWWLASLALLAARPLPLGALRTLGRALGHAAHRLVRSARRTARDNVARVYPGLDVRSQRDLVRRSFLSLGELLGETVAMLRPGAGPPRLLVTDEARSVLDAARAEGRGVLFASAHLGPWESVAASLVAAGVPLVALVRESYDPRFSALYEKLRSRHGVPVVWRARPGAAARILRTLRGGAVLGVPMDLRSRVPSCDAPFLGHVAPTAVGPARIALRARAAVVVGTAAPGTGGSLVITATRILSADLARDEASALELTARINAELSRRILALPHAWVWMHDRWTAGTGV